MIASHLSKRLIWIALVLLGTANGVRGEGRAIDFRRDIRPILSNNCFACHGPDEEHREADLRLDQPDAATESAIVPGDSNASELIARVTTDDADRLMPPADSGKHLTPEQIELLRRWIDEGAAFDGHWAFVPPQRPELPQVRHSDWVRNPLDAFVLHRIEQANETPSPEADRVTLAAPRESRFDRIAADCRTSGCVPG